MRIYTKLCAKQFETYRSVTSDATTCHVAWSGGANLTFRHRNGNLVIFNGVCEGDPCIFYRRQYSDYNESRDEQGDHDEIYAEGKFPDSSVLSDRIEKRDDEYYQRFSAHRADSY